MTQTAIVTLLLAYSPDPDQLIQSRDTWGRTPVHLAARAGNVAVLNMMEFGSSVMTQVRPYMPAAEARC